MEKRSVVAIWLADFPTFNQFSAYLKETYDEGRGNRPLSAFAADFDLFWYDHDFIEADYRQDQAAIAALLKPFSYSDSFLQSVVEFSRTAGTAGARAAILLYDFEYVPGRGVGQSNTTVRFVGNFSYSRN